MPEEIMDRQEAAAPCYLSDDEKQRTRELYEAAFPEDSGKFVDYYYKYKARDNEILGIWKDNQVVSMLHLNPYTMAVNGYEAESFYIVAVATRKDCRRQGYMEALLKKALQDMARRRLPFVFLMPASERIYAPYDFVWICPYSALPRHVRQMEAGEQNRYLAARYQMFCRRDGRYMENMRAQTQAEQGEAPPGKMPPYMARITDVCRMLGLTRSMKEQRLYLHVKDAIIEENNGYFCWEVSRERSHAEKLCRVPGHTDLDMSIGELASMVFGSFRICLSELV